MGAHSMDFITGGCDVALPAKPFRGCVLMDVARVEAADGNSAPGCRRHCALQGREPGRAALEDFTQTKTVQMHIAPRTGWWLPG